MFFYFILLIYVIAIAFFIAEKIRVHMEILPQCGVISIVFIFLTVVCISIATESGVERIHHKEKIHDIVSLKTNSDISGSFVLGTGHIDEKEYYYTFAEVSKNRYKRAKFPTEDTYLEETNEKEPQVIKIYYQSTPNYKIIPKWLYPHSSITKKEYCIYVPKGTIYKEFNAR